MSHDTWLHRAGQLIARPLADTPVTPNQLTSVRLASGLGGAALIGAGAAPWVQIGAGLFIISMLFDRADGVLARLTGRTTPWGHTYDLVADALCNAVVFVGIGFGLRDGAFGDLALPMGFAAGVSIALILWLVMRIESAHGARGAELGSVAGFDPDDAMLLVPAALLLGWSEPLLAAAAGGAPAFAIYMFWRFRHGPRRAGR